MFPTERAYDRDADGLVDIEVTFASRGRGVPPAHVSLVSDPAFGGSGGSSPNLLDLWRVDRMDDGGFVVEETVEHLLPRGEVRLQVTVVDRMGNRVSRARELSLPPAALHKVIDLGTRTFLTTQILVRPDGGAVYVTTEEHDGSAITIVDGKSLERIKTERTALPGLSRMAWDSRRSRVYAMSIDEPYLAVFDAGTQKFEPSIQTAARGISVAVSDRRDRIYVGLEAWGLISVVNPSLGVQERVIHLDLPESEEAQPRLGLQSLVFDGEEHFLYAAANIDIVPQQGLLVIDPDQGILVDQIDLWPEWTGLGGGYGIVRDGSDLVLTSGDPDGTGLLGKMSLRDPSRPTFGETGRFVSPVRVAVNQPGTEYGIVTGDGGSGNFALQLIDATSLQIVWEEKFPRSSAGMRQDIAFHPEGKVFFVVGTGKDTEFEAQPNELSVYLYRR